jgi:hypothetical protein
MKVCRIDTIKWHLEIGKRLAVWKMAIGVPSRSANDVLSCCLGRRCRVVLRLDAVNEPQNYIVSPKLLPTLYSKQKKGCSRVMRLT